jgi:hypothetical protein
MESKQAQVSWLEEKLREQRQQQQQQHRLEQQQQQQHQLALHQIEVIAKQNAFMRSEYDRLLPTAPWAVPVETQNGSPSLLSLFLVPSYQDPTHPKYAHWFSQL